MYELNWLDFITWLLPSLSCSSYNSSDITLLSSGLAAAYKLKLHGFNVTVFEADGRAGGKLRSVCQDGLIWDEGANTMVC